MLLTDANSKYTQYYQLIVYRPSFITMWLTLDSNKVISQLGTKCTVYIYLNVFNL